VNIRLCLVLTFALSGLAWATVNAQQPSQGAGSMGGTASPYGTSPYAQQHSQGYTSFDNPYAPGGIYDPYRNSTLNSAKKRGTQKKSGTSMLRSMQTAKMGDKKNIFGGGSDNSSGSSSDGSSGGGPDGSSSSSGSNSYSDSDRYSYSSRLSSNQLGGNILGIKTQCSGNRSGSSNSNGGGSAAGSGMNHQDSANPYSGFSQCGSNPGYGSTSSNGTASSGGTKGHMGMNSQSHSGGMGQQQSQQQR